MCGKFVYVKLLYVKFVCVKFVCVEFVRGRRRAAGGGGGEGEGEGARDTKMWGTKRVQLLSVLLGLLLLVLLVLLLQLLLQASKTYLSPHRNTMPLKDGTTSKNTLPRGLTSLLDPVKNKATAAAGLQNVPLLFENGISLFFGLVMGTSGK